ncbi:hypothetical protein HX122_13135 [Acinetobacter towneri]|uniref:hypothetical protein n=1 Tax=Acinetobacter towneri TaxID=202956 RepID=UPI002578F429|nr:hypothetical protein [Acinetobacter towneri]MDM1755854.1 hypothetical protein [Acinetobacter towneri]
MEKNGVYSSYTQKNGVYSSYTLFLYSSYTLILPILPILGVYSSYTLLYSPILSSYTLFVADDEEFEVLAVINLSPTKDVNGNYGLIFYTAIEDEEINEYNAGMLFSDIVLVYDNGYFNTVRFEDIIDEDQETILDEGIHNTRIEIEGYEFEIKIKTILDEISSDDFSKNLAFNNKIEIDKINPQNKPII